MGATQPGLCEWRDASNDNDCKNECRGQFPTAGGERTGSWDTKGGVVPFKVPLDEKNSGSSAGLVEGVLDEQVWP